MNTVECLGDAARGARECAVMGQAVRRVGPHARVCREHEITLEKTVPRDHSQVYPVCVEYRGGSPVEYWSAEEPGEPAPFGIKKGVNRRLAALGREPA